MLTVCQCRARAGASLVSFHAYASSDPARTLKLIHELGAQTGLVFSPTAPLDTLQTLLDQVDLVLLMGVEPGFGGQIFIESTLARLAQVRTLLDACGRHLRLEVDGGVKIDNICHIADAGADTFVVGSAIFDTLDYQKTIDAFYAALKLR